MLLYMDRMHPGKYKLSSVSFEMLVIGNSQRSLRRSMGDPGTCTSIFGSIVGKRNQKKRIVCHYQSFAVPASKARERPIHKLRCLSEVFM